MIVYTIEDFNKTNVNEIKICDDYSLIELFHGFNFGEMCKLEYIHGTEQIVKVIRIGGIGSQKGYTYFFKTLSEIYVRCGCFFDTIAEFEAQVNTHKNNKQYKKEYLEEIKYIKAVMQND